MVRYNLFGKMPVNGIKIAFNAICDSTTKQLSIKEDLIFDVSIVSSSRIKSINKQYRNIDKVTDVITFANRDNKTIFVPLLGEIFICLDQAKKQAKLYKHSLQRELIFLFTHGLLHLLGFDHQSPKDEKKMIAASDKIINNAKILPKYIIK